MTFVKCIKIAAAMSLGMAFFSTASWAGSCEPSKWGGQDELGAANLITTESVAAAVSLVKKGETHALGIVIDSQTPAFPPRSVAMQIVSPGQHNGRSLVGTFGWDMTYNDDVVQMWLGVGSQLDGLGHLGEAGTYYNCNEAEDFITITGAKKLGIENVPPLVTRGVMLDMPKYFGVKAMEGGQPITVDDIKGAAIAQNLDIREGDVVLIHTGWIDSKLASDPAAWGSSEPGLDNAAMKYLTTLNPVAIGADNWGVEVSPPVSGDKVYYGHVYALKENGVYLLEGMNTGRLASEGVSEFLFVLGQARLRGAVQMIINPVAMW